MLSRRSILRGLLAAPAIIAVERLMPVKLFVDDPWKHIFVANGNVYVDGYASTELVDLSAFKLGSGDFTVRAWVKGWKKGTILTLEDPKVFITDLNLNIPSSG